MAGRVRGTRGPHRGGSAEPNPSPSHERKWTELTLDALMFTILLFTMFVLAAPMARFVWALVARSTGGK